MKNKLQIKLNQDINKKKYSKKKAEYKMSWITKKNSFQVFFFPGGNIQIIELFSKEKFRF